MPLRVLSVTGGLGLQDSLVKRAESSDEGKTLQTERDSNARETNAERYQSGKHLCATFCVQRSLVHLQF